MKMRFSRGALVCGAYGCGEVAAMWGTACLCLSPRARSQSPPSQQQIAPVVESPDRSTADKTNATRRKPEQMLAFIGPRPGMTALDVSAGGGYPTQLLARAI